MYDQYNRGEIELLTPHEVLDETELFIRSVDAEGRCSVPIMRPTISLWAAR